MQGFEGLSSAFNVDDDFKKAVDEVEKDMDLIETKKNEITTKANNPLVFQNQEFIRTELRSLIMSARTVMNKVEQDIKIGSDNRKVEVYAKLVESIGKQYQSLMELDKNIFEALVATNQVDVTNIGNNKISLSSEQLLDMLDKAKENSEMNKIDASFEIHDENIAKKKEG